MYRFSCKGRFLLFLTYFLVIFTVFIGCENPLMKQVFGLKTISFNTNGGSAIESQHLLPGETVARPSDPVKAQYVFGGWFTDNDTFLNQWDFRVAPDREFVLYAKWIAEDTSEYTLILDTGGLDDRDSVSFSDSGAFEITALGGSVVLINYTLADTENSTSELRFYIKGARIFTVNEYGFGIFDYIVNAGHAIDGIITIKAVSVHTDLIPLDEPTGVSFNSDGVISFAPGENNENAGASFRFSLYRNASPVSGFSNMPIAGGGGDFAQLRAEMLKDAGAYSVRVWAETANPDYLSPSIAVYSNNVDVYRLILDTDDLYILDSVSFSNTGSVLETTAFGGTVIPIYYTLAGVYDNNLLSLYIDGNRKYETTAPGTGSYDYAINSDDADNRVITMYARSVHSNLELLFPPTNIHLEKSGVITFTADSRNPAGTSYRYTLYGNNSAISGFTEQSITSGATPAGIAEEMLKSPGDYHAAVWAQTGTEGYEPLSSVVNSNLVHVYSVSVNISGAGSGETVSVNGRAGEHTVSFEFYAFGGDTVTLNAMPGAGRMVTWSGVGTGTGSTRTVTVTGTTTVTAAFANAAVTVTVGSITTGYATLDAALASISGAGTYTVTLLQDQTMTAARTFTAGMNVTLTGLESERKITYGLSDVLSAMFSINSATASLTFLENITVQGRSSEGSGAVVRILGGTLNMMDSCKITRHNSGNVMGAVVYLNDSSAVFNMQGGEITGNNSNISTQYGSVTVVNGFFNMTGGSITDNAGVNIYAADVFMETSDTVSSRIQISGASHVGVLLLKAINETVHTKIEIGASFTGNVDTLNLFAANGAVQTVISWWENKQVLEAVNGHTLTQAEVGRFTLGRFLSSNITNNQQITATHIIGTSGDDVGKLILNHGSGTSDKPFLIYSEADLRAVGCGNYKGMNWTTSAHYKLMSDFNLTGKDDWVPIGLVSGGVFDGNGHTITGLTISSTSSYQGMFSRIGGRVENLKLENVNISSTQNYIGAIAGEITSSGTISNCSVSGSVSGVYGVGGLVGSNYGIIQNSFSAANVTASGSGDFGGIAGFSHTSGGTIRNCYSTGTVTGGTVTGASVGGIVGGQGGPLSNCFAAGAVNGTERIGGIAGYISDPGKIEGSIALNRSITRTGGASTSFGRVTGSVFADGTHTNNNRAWSAMPFDPSNLRTVTSNINGADGLGVTTAELRTYATWTAAGFAFGTTEAAPWVWDSTGTNMPRLYWQINGIPWPAHLVDPVTVNNGTTTTGYADLTAALASISSAGNYDVKIGTNQSLAPYTLNVPGADITLTAAGADVTVQLASAGSMFTVNSGTTLRLSNGVTLQGINANIIALVQINGGNLYMSGSARVTGNTLTINTDVTHNGGGIHITDGGSFNMSGGIINNNKTLRNGGGVFVINNGNFLMTGGEISANESGSAAGGGVAVSSGGTFTMQGGEIRNNTSVQGGGLNVGGVASLINGVIKNNNATNAGGVAVSSSGTFTMQGGEISDNTASTNGGGLYVWGEFKLIDGVIKNNTASVAGGVGVNLGGTFTMHDGEISGNNAGTSGGGLYVWGGFVMQDGKINGNTATQAGGGVFVHEAPASFTMEGGEISGNTARTNGGGVSVASNGIFVKTGNSVITGYNSDNVNGNAVKNASGAPISNNGHAVYFNYSTRRLRETTVGAEDNLDGNGTTATGTSPWD
ncbi:MAG: InlB B-repeat-containing protein [Treponema sp.]|nr:InlB B-repeat-containing protein [Treponema sp.]